ncbi:MAG: asparagine synthetase B, partial [Chitinophagaceae bacterium]|nr:asparagine synthetase B [Chitinophagaceae bacterium]
ALMDIVPADKIPVLNKKYLFHSRYEKVKSLLKEPSAKNILMSLTRQMGGRDLTNLFIDEFKNMPSYFDSSDLSSERYSVLSYMMAIDYQTYLLDDILQKVDRAGMSVSLEGREPFLDHRIIEWAAQLPLDYKYNKGNKKFILKEIVHKYIPATMMDRPKMGFGIPIANWLQNNLKPFVDLYFDEQFISRQNIFNNDEIQKIKKSFYEGKVERAEKIWYILMFQMWYDKWIINN